MSNTSITYKNVNMIELNKRISLDIILDSSIQPVCFSGQLITGHVYLETKDVLSVQILQVELLGRGVVVTPHKKLLTPKNFTRGWTKERKSIQRNFTSYQGVGCIISGLNGPVDPEILQTRLKCKFMKGFDKLIPVFQTVNEEIYCSMNSTLIGGGIPGSCELVLTGKRCYSFEFELPATCPCSFVGSRGSIEYRLRVYLLLSNGDHLYVDKGLKVIRKMINNKIMIIPSTLACPPITRNYVSSFDQFMLNGNTVKFTNLSRTNSRLANLHRNEIESVLDEYDNSDQKLIEKNSVFDSTCTNDNVTDRLSFAQSVYSNTDLDDTTKLTKYSVSSCLNDSHQSNPYLSSIHSTEGENRYAMDENNQNSSVQSMNKIHSDHTVTRKKSLYHSRNTTKLTVQRCSDNPFPLPSTWISQQYGSGYATYPRTCLGAQTGYPISCRLTVSQRHLNPGDRLTACLSLLVEDPFALLLAPSLNGISNDLNWCAKFNANIKSRRKDLWSPLARSFVSYYLEDCIRRKFGDESQNLNGIWWSGYIKQPHRIFLILRQVTTYRDWTNRVIAQEERDVYSGEMRKRPTSEKHLLRVVLEHTFHIPSLPPTGLEGCSCIDVAYSLGLVSFKLKKLKYSLKPSKWILENDVTTVTPDKFMEFVYMHEASNKNNGTYEMMSKKPRILTFQQTKRVKENEFKRFAHIHHDLLLPIPIIIGTTDYNWNSDRQLESYSQTEPQKAECPLMGSIFFMQWPNSYQIGSLPPIYQCLINQTVIYQDGSIRNDNVSHLSNLIQAQSLNDTIKLRKSNTISFSDTKQIINNEDDENVENSSLSSNMHTSCRHFKSINKYNRDDSNSRVDFYPSLI
ncbi:hypothetical protein MN116_000925 [Schistosoma mekongi]|uniref:Arrestin-like N-terminal domain-containing protein n=1 Tax=Schistosoma mekongi TaxID=38744 RepID=A0AAE1ZK79_SCHME|nr:hypothetical protein MN116_000925 [Schistosoma mekongi]